jgi:superfamily II DNA or RNA helicase
MKGLYLLSTNLLKQLNTIKFGMSMRIEYRWQDYLVIFNDAKYEYFYEFLNDFTKEQILDVESEIIKLHESSRNKHLQTEYFKCDNIELFHKTVIDILNKRNIKYKDHKGHPFDRTYYDNNPEKFKQDNIIKLDRYGQEDAFEKFRSAITNEKYWGLMIAPTGWGKTLMHLIFFGYYLSKNKNKNVMLLTKKKDLLKDINNDIEQDIKQLCDSGFYDEIPNIEYYVEEEFNPIKINSTSKQSIIIINIDKIINKLLNREKKECYDPLKKIKLIQWNKIGFVIFDEVHHIGSSCAFNLMNYVKNEAKVKYCIGSSATPVRNNFENQNNIRKLFNCNDFIVEKAELDKTDVNILHEITYKEAWDNKIILPIKIELIILKNIMPIHDKTKNIIGWKYDPNDKIIIKNKIIDILQNSFKKKIIFYTSNRLSCLEWFEYLSNNECFNDYNKYISFSSSGSYYKEDDEIIVEESINLNDKINKKIKELDINKDNLSDGIENFKNNSNSSFLFVVGRATEGYNDKPLDIVFNLDPVIDRSILLELQKMGRTTRIIEGKQTGYYIIPIIKTEDYVENMSKFMADFINAIIKPINEKNSDSRPPTIHEYNGIYNKIFNIDGFEQIEHNKIYDMVLKNLNPDITYGQAIKIIKNSIPKPYSKDDYLQLCRKDTRLYEEPDKIFKNFNWIEYLSILRTSYNFNDCKERVKHLLKENPNIHKKEPSETCYELCKIDSQFPPNGMWKYYYEVPISELIPNKIKQKFIKR